MIRTGLCVIHDQFVCRYGKSSYCEGFLYFAIKFNGIGLALDMPHSRTLWHTRRTALFFPQLRLKQQITQRNVPTELSRWSNESRMDTYVTPTGEEKMPMA